MPDDNNLPVPIDGDQAIIGTDVYSSGGETAHAQVMKVAWGDQNTVNRANTNSPLPVKVYGMSGPFDTITVTGAVRGLGTFTIGNTSGSPVHVTGGVNSFVYGVVGATPVAVTGAVNILSAIGITGVVNITGGRYLNSTTDSVIVGGTVARNWNLTNLNDNVTVYGFGGATFLSSKIMGSDGTVIGNSGGALNVNVIGAGISATVNIGSVVGVQNATGSVLRIEGTAGGTPVQIEGEVSLSSSSKIEITNDPLEIDVKFIGMTFAGAPQFPANTLNINKLLTYYEVGQYYTIPWFLREMRGDLGWGTAAGSLAKRMNQLVTDGGEVKTGTFVGVRTFNATKNAINTYNIAVNSNSAVLIDPSGVSKNIKHGVTIKNTHPTASVILGAAINNPAVSLINWSAPDSDVYYGIHLGPSESIFIPNSISMPDSNGQFPIATTPPPMYGKVYNQTGSVTATLFIMAV